MPIPWNDIAKARRFENVKQMFQAYYPKHSIHALAAMFGCSISSVRKQLDLAGLEIRGRGGTQSSPKLDEVSEAEYKEKGARKLALEHGVDITTVYKSMRRRGFQPPKISQRSEEQTQSEPASPEAPPDQVPSLGSPSLPGRREV